MHRSFAGALVLEHVRAFLLYVALFHISRLTYVHISARFLSVFGRVAARARVDLSQRREGLS